MLRSLLKRPSGTPDLIRNESGAVLPVIMGFVFIFALEIVGLSEYAASAMRQVRAQESRVRALYLAEAATDKSLAQVKMFFASNGAAPTAAQLQTMSADTPNIPAQYTYADGGGTNTLDVGYYGNWTAKTLSVGDYAGLNGNTQSIDVSVQVRDLTGQTQSTLTLNQRLEVQLIPIFQFGVFYENDLEILPGANMTFAGPVHGNKNLYLAAESGASLSFQSQMTAAGDIFHGRKDSVKNMPGAVNIQDGSGTNQNMSNGDGTWLDSNDPDWLLESHDRWDGNVSSADHGVSQLKIPLPTGSQAQVMIDRRVAGESAEVQAQKMDYKAHLRIIDGQVYNSAGNTVELRYCSGGGNFSNGTCPQGQTVVNPVTSTTFYNGREGRTIKSTDIDVAKLNSSPAFQTIKAGVTGGVILYTSDRRSQGSNTYQDAVRLVNGSTLPTGGMTVASENPLYIKGNYNTVNKQPSGVVGDSFNVLSNAWNDGNSTQGLSNRVASNTTVQTAVIAGNTETVTGSYNGGFENLPRFLENWSGKTLTYKGSVITLYNSRIATGAWNTGGVYNPPSRAWSFDTDFSDPSYSIPGFPSVYNIVKSSYEAV
ncbi:MAG: hypothetical protein MOGMAGMI_02059 [Candidatus Omnitrophica bacterium]|nr:hypothetical protein [Candidatus Omnitrophota bacterium]